MVHLKKGTRKHIQDEKHAKAMTIPELRRAFERIEALVAKKPDVDAFRKLWKKIFGKDVSKAAAQDYLAFVATEKPTQKGGAAPLDYTTRPGVDDLTYGSFPKYVMGGMSFPKDGFHMSGEDISPRIPAGLGSNVFTKGGGKRSTRRSKKQSGGAVFPALAEAMTRPFLMNSPPSALQDMQMLAKGMNTLPSPRPEINPLSLAREPGVFSSTAVNLPQTV